MYPTYIHVMLLKKPKNVKMYDVLLNTYQQYLLK